MATVRAENRFSPITPDDHAGSVWIAALLCLVYSVITLCLRCHLRWKMYGVDDYLALCATVLQIGEVGAVVVGLNHGLGQTEELLRADELREASRAAFAGVLLFVLAAAAAKASTLCLMMRLFNLTGPKAQNVTRPKFLYWSCIGLLVGMGIYGLVSIVALSADCRTSAFIRGGQGQCSHQLLRWQIITAFDVATECILVLLSMFIVWPVQLAFAMKCQVVLAFAFRLPVAALSIVHVKFISDYTKASNPGTALVLALVIQQVQLCWSIIAATVPNLKSFVKSFSSGFGIQLDPDSTGAYSSQRYARNNGYELRSVNGNGDSRSKSISRSCNDLETQSNLPRPMDDAKPTLRDQESMDSGDSQGHIIRKDVEWDLHYENH